MQEYEQQIVENLVLMTADVLSESSEEIRLKLFTALAGPHMPAIMAGLIMAQEK